MVATEFRNQNAVISDCTLYRYWLERDLGTLSGSGVCVFIMLNPSTADGDVLDPTCVRCGNFAKSWGYAHAPGCGRDVPRQRLSETRSLQCSKISRFTHSGLTKFSDPLHPLYLRADLQPQPIRDLQAGQFAERRGQQ